MSNYYFVAILAVLYSRPMVIGIEMCRLVIVSELGINKYHN